MTLSNKPLEELQALRRAVEAAIAAKAVDPLLIEAREVCSGWAKLYSDPSVEAPDKYRSGKWDDASHMKIALAALNRGMELQRLAPAEPVEPVDDAWIERTARDARFGATWRDKEVVTDYAERVARAAVRATLARCARWPEEAVPIPREVFAYLNGDGALDGKGYGDGPPCGKPHFWWRIRLRAYQTGAAS